MNILYMWALLYDRNLQHWIRGIFFKEKFLNNKIVWIIDRVFIPLASYLTGLLCAFLHCFMNISESKAQQMDIWGIFSINYGDYGFRPDINSYLLYFTTGGTHRQCIATSFVCVPIYIIYIYNIVSVSPWRYVYVI